MLFDQTAPLSAVAMPQSYYQGDPTKLKFLGYNPDGTRNTWGKILGWVPQASMTTNYLAKREFQSERATDALANQQEWAQRDMSKSMFSLNGGIAAAGAVTGNPQLAMQGLTGMGKTLGNTLNPVQPKQANPLVSYLNPYNFQ